VPRTGRLLTASSCFHSVYLLSLLAALLFPNMAAAQTFSAVLTDPAATGKESEQAKGTARLTLDASKETLEFFVVLRPVTPTQQISVNLGTPSDPGPAIFVLADAESQNPIHGAVHRGAETSQPEHGINGWDDAIRALSQSKTFLRVESSTYPISGLAGTLKPQ
jgi:hypothetical protein